MKKIFKKLILCFLIVFCGTCIQSLLFGQTGYSPKLTLDDVYNAIPAMAEQSGFSESTGKVMLITKNIDSWYARWSILENAKKSIDITYFIYEKDIFGKALLGLLFKKAKQGLKIRIMADARGTTGLVRSFFGQDYLQKLARYPNVNVKNFNPVLWAISTVLFKGFRTILASNHDKIIVVDNEWVVLGGRNISKDYFAAYEDDDSVFRDTDVVIKSREIARVTTVAFLEEFVRLNNTKIRKDFLNILFGFEKNNKLELEVAYDAMICAMTNIVYHENNNPETDDEVTKDILSKKLIIELASYPRVAGYIPFMKKFYSYFYKTGKDNEYPIKVLDKHTIYGKRNDITINLVRMMDTSKDEIIIQNPYIVLTEIAWDALRRAAARGVKIIIHTNSPMTSDCPLIQAAFVNDWKNILRDMPMSRIFVMRKHRLHAKVFVFDKKISVIGTYNMDYMSQDINSEVVCLINSEKFAFECRKRIMDDIKNESLEYRIQIGKKGKIKVLFGPKDHCSKKLLFKMSYLKLAAKILRKLI